MRHSFNLLKRKFSDDVCTHGKTLDRRKSKQISASALLFAFVLTHQKELLEQSFLSVRAVSTILFCQG